MRCAGGCGAALTILALVPALGILASSAQGAPPALYHSPADDGVSGGVPASVPSGQPVTLHLYVDGGSSASTADPCFQGDGDELCGYRLRLTGSGVDLQSFAPADPDTLFNLAAQQIDLIGGDFVSGQLGPTKLGDLVIEGPAEGGTLDLQLGEFATAALAKEQAATPATIAALPEPAAPASLALGGALLAALRRFSRQRRSQRPSPHRSSP